MNNGKIVRRSFIQKSALFSGTLAMSLPYRPCNVDCRTEYSPKANRFCAFVKFVQELKPDQLAETLKELGYDGGEVTVRPGGYISPENAADMLPEVHAAFQKCQLSIDIITTAVSSIESPNASQILKTAGELGIPFYRMGFCHYDLKKEVIPQVTGLQNQFSELADLSRQSNISGVYQNHSGPQYVGATFWDLQKLLENIPRQQIGVIFDVRHACVEGGLSWSIYYDIIKPHITAFSMKDFRWVGRKVENVALGKGMVDPSFYSKAQADFPNSLYSVHVEYLEQDGLQPNIAALKTDLATLRSRLTE